MVKLRLTLSNPGHFVYNSPYHYCIIIIIPYKCNLMDKSKKKSFNGLNKLYIDIYRAKLEYWGVA